MNSVGMVGSQRRVSRQRSTRSRLCRETVYGDCEGWTGAMHAEADRRLSQIFGVMGSGPLAIS